VLSGKTSMAILPVETSSQGHFSETYDTLIQNTDLRIVADLSTREEHCFGVKEGVKIGDVKKVLSHPEILAQCSKFIKEISSTGHKLRLIPTPSSTGACRLLNKEYHTDDGSVIGSKDALEAEGLQIIKEGVGNDKNAQTRYILVSTQPEDQVDALQSGGVRAVRGGGVRASAVFSLPNEPDALFRVLGHLALRHVELRSLVMRPQSALKLDKKWFYSAVHWSYVIVLEWEPCRTINDEALLQAMKECSVAFRYLGKYPSFVKYGRVKLPSWKDTWLRVAELSSH